MSVFGVETVLEAETELLAFLIAGDRVKAAIQAMKHFDAIEDAKSK